MKEARTLSQRALRGQDLRRSDRTGVEGRIRALSRWRERMKKKILLTGRRKEGFRDEDESMDCMPDLSRVPGGVRFFEQDNRSVIEKR